MDLNAISERLEYNPINGKFAWKIARIGILIGSTAGSINSHGYITIKINGVAIKGHRLAWWMTNGVTADGMLDHINGDRADNRIANLRIVTATQNCFNRAVRCDSKSGVKGVHWNAKACRWVAVIREKGMRRTQSFKDIDSAKFAYKKMEKEIYGEYTRTE